MSINWPEGFDRIILDETDTTMSEARRRGPLLHRPTWILAHHQTAAKGRRGRKWVSPRGNFSATLFFRPGGSLADASLRSFTAACALHAALSETGGKLTLKWPNDVLLDGGKVAGILLESSGSGTECDWLSIGIGVNLVSSPGPEAVEKDAVPPVSVQAGTGNLIQPEDLLMALASHFAAFEIQFQTFGFGPIRQFWLQHAANIGQEVRVRTGQQVLYGIFESLDEEGQLVLKTTDGVQRIAAGDVFFT